MVGFSYVCNVPFLAFWNWWSFILECVICRWLCCTMVMFIFVFCWSARFCNTWVYLCLQWLCCILSYDIHEGPYCIVNVLHGYVALWLCSLISFVGLWLSRRNGFLGVQHASMIMLHYDIYQRSYWITTFIDGHVALWLCL